MRAALDRAEELAAAQCELLGCLQSGLDRLHHAVREIAPLHVRMARLSLGFTQPALARAAGVSISCIKILEGSDRGKTISAATAERILAVLLQRARDRHVGPNLIDAIKASVLAHAGEPCHDGPDAAPDSD